MYFSPELVKADSSEHQLDQEMRSALHNGDMCMHFQPRIDIKTGEMCSVEALMRWIVDTPDGPVVRAHPDTFITVAERTGFVSELDKFALQECCRFARRWQLAGARLCVSVNLSVIKLQQDDIVSQVREILKRSQVDPSLIELEITESAAMTNVEHNVHKLGQLRELGLKLSIDDFGTGYSSLNYLKRLPVDTLKIDRSFIADIRESDGSDSVDSAIVRAVVALARSMDFGVVAEGVETAEQLKFLKSLGCDQVQGYYFSRSQPPEVIDSMLAELTVHKKAA